MSTSEVKIYLTDRTDLWNYDPCWFSADLLDSIFRGASDPRMAVMFELYFDESGTHDEGWLTLAGVVGEKEQWSRFSEEWLECLSPTPFEYFHAKDFFRWAKQRENDQIAKDVLHNLLGALLRRGNRAFCYSMPVHAYKSETSNAFRSRFGAAYTMCAQECLLEVLEWCGAHGYTEPMAYFFEDGHRNAIQLCHHFEVLKKNRGLKVRSFTMASKDDFVPLQAADLVAYRMNARARENPRFLTDTDYERKFSEFVGPSICADRKRFEWMVECSQDVETKNLNGRAKE